MDGKPKILVVEDESSIRRLIRASLGEAYAITETPSGEEAVKELERESFDLLVLDLMLDDISGWEVLERMRRLGLRDGVKVMTLTARTAEGDILRGWQNGVDQYCMKPFEPEELVAAVEGVLAASRADLAQHRRIELDRTKLLHLVDTVFEP